MTLYKNIKTNILNLFIGFLFIGATSVQAENAQYQSDSTLIAYLKEAGLTTTNGNEVFILKSGHEKFIDLFEKIRNARHHIHLEYFNFRNDSIANCLFSILEEKVKEGVQVRAIYDAFGNSSNNQPLKKKHIKALKERGIEIEEFDPIRFPWINHVFHRDHRKIVVIDGKIGYTGGMNIADYYINGLPKIGEWRDMHIRIEGRAVENLQAIFLDMWNRTTGEEISGDAYFPYKKDSTVISDGGKEIAIVDRYPRRNPKLMRRAYAKAIESAENRVQIINPYFTPTRIIKKAIKKAVKKGADIYIFNGGFHHSKIMMVDSLFCTVGSTNLNSRSLRYDYEVNAFIFDQQTTGELIGIFKEDQANSTLLTSEIYKKRSPLKKFWGWFAHLFTPFL